MMLRPLRRQAVYLKSPRTSPRSPFLTQVRRQHQKEEKWYFQNQDQSAPQTLPPTVPDGSPVVLPSNVHTGKARSRPFDYKRSLLWAFAAGLSGWLAAAYITRWAVLSMTAPFPEPGSPQDKTKLAAIVKRFEAQEVVKTMRESGDWKEWEAYSNLEPGDRMHRLTSGPLSGSRGLALQRVFWNEKEKRCVTFLVFGSGLGGWPLFIHGGALSTVIDEALGRVAIRNFPAKTGVTASLGIRFMVPVRPAAFYSLQAEAVPSACSDTKAIVIGKLVDSKGKLCCEATGLFVVPKRLQLQKIEDEF